MKEFNDNNLQEFPVYADEFTTSVQNALPNEREVSKVNPSFASDKNTSMQSQKTKKSKKADLNSLIKLLSVCMVTVTVGVGVVVGATSASVVNAVFTAQLNAIDYFIEIQSDSDLTLCLENDFTKREVSLKNGVNQGSITGLKPNMQYTVKVLSGEGLSQSSIKKYTVKTLTPEQAIPPNSEFYGVQFTPAENLSGSAKVTVDFNNGANDWSQISLNVCDQTGINTTINGITSNTEFLLNLSQVGFLSSRATLTVSVTHSKTNESEILHSEQINLSTLETYYQVSVVKAGSNGYAEYTFNVVDNNGIWDENTIFNASLIAEDKQFEYLTENYTLNDSLKRFISKNEFESGNGILNLQAIKNDKTYNLLEQEQTIVTEEWFTRESVNEFLSIDIIPAQNLNDVFTFIPYFANEDGLFKRIQVAFSDSTNYGSFVIESVENGKPYSIELSQYEFLTSDGILNVSAMVEEYIPSSDITVEVPETVYEEHISLSVATTNYSFEVVQPAGTDNICYYTVNFVDENGVWGENPVFKVLFSGNSDYVECVSGETLQLTVLKADYPSGTDVIELTVNIDGEDICLTYLSVNLVSAEWTGE